MSTAPLRNTTARWRDLDRAWPEKGPGHSSDMIAIDGYVLCYKVLLGFGVLAARMRQAGVYGVPVRHGVRIALCSTPTAAVPRLVEAIAAGVAAAGE